MLHFVAVFNLTFPIGEMISALLFSSPVFHFVISRFEALLPFGYGMSLSVMFHQDGLHPPLSEVVISIVWKLRCVTLCPSCCSSFAAPSQVYLKKIFTSIEFITGLIIVWSTLIKSHYLITNMMDQVRKIVNLLQTPPKFILES